MDTASYFHPAATFLTSATIFLAVIAGPEGILSGFLCPGRAP